MPAIRALVQLRDVAADLGMLDRLRLVVNRAASGISVEDIERSANLPAYAQIRSAGMLIVQANNEGRTLFEIGPRERITEDFVSPRGQAARHRAGCRARPCVDAPVRPTGGRPRLTDPIRGASPPPSLPNVSRPPSGGRDALTSLA